SRKLAVYFLGICEKREKKNRKEARLGLNAGISFAEALYLDRLIKLPLQGRQPGGGSMMFLMVLSLCTLILWPTGEAWSQKSLSTVRIGIEAVAGTNSHYYVTQQLGLFQKQGLSLELISFPGGTVGIQSLLAGDLQFATADGNLGLTANLRGANLYFIAGMINTFPFSILSRPEIRTPQTLRVTKCVISRYGASSETAVRAAVEKYALRPDKDVIRLQGGGQSARFAALRAGAVDAAIVSPPLNLTGRRLGFNEVIDLSESGVPYAH